MMESKLKMKLICFLYFIFCYRTKQQMGTRKPAGFSQEMRISILEQHTGLICIPFYTKHCPQILFVGGIPFSPFPFLMTNPVSKLRPKFIKLVMLLMLLAIYLWQLTVVFPQSVRVSFPTIS